MGAIGVDCPRDKRRHVVGITCILFVASIIRFPRLKPIVILIIRSRFFNELGCYFHTSFSFSLELSQSLTYLGPDFRNGLFENSRIKALIFPL